MAQRDFTKDAGVEAGFSRGNDITVTDFNGSVDFIGKAHVNLSDSTIIGGTASAGPELTHDSRDYTVLVDLTYSQRLTDTVSLLVDGLYDHTFGNADPTNGTGSAGLNNFGYPFQPFYHLPSSAYGASANLVWQVNDYVALAGRGEWLRDDGGLLSGVSRSLYEATVAATVKPFPLSGIGQNLKVRPEVRYDYCNKAFFGPTPQGTPTGKDQLTAAVDVIYNF